MLVDIKLSKAQLSKIIQSGGDLLFRGQLIQAKKAPIIVTIPLPRDDFPGLVSNLASNAINNFERKISRKGAVRAGKGFNLFIWNEDMIDINKIIKSLEDSNALKHGTSKHEIKKQEGVFFPYFVSNFSRFVSATSGRVVRRAERGYIDKNFQSHSIL